MKNKNRENSDRRVVFLVVLVLLASLGCNPNNHGQILTNNSTTDTIVFEGTLETLGPDLKMASGVLAVYRLAKYRVDRVCEGKYDQSEIVVDHLILSTKEFEGIDVNDRVCLKVRMSNKILARYNADGIRSPSDDVKTFYIAQGEPKTINGREKCCDTR